jgi:restriction endonuclease S subunit
MSFTFYKETNFKEILIGKTPKDWRIAKVDELFDLYKGTTPSTKIKEYWNGTIPFVTPTDITKINDSNEIYLESTENYITEKGLKSKGLKLVPKGSLLFTSRATIGYLAINKTEVAINQGIISLIPKDANIDVTFFYYFFQKLKSLFENLAGGSTYKEISMSTFSNVDMPIPSLSEQQKIAEILLIVDEAIQKTNEVIAKTERLKKGLMQELLIKGLILGFMFDTNIFDEILNEKIELPKNLKYYVTHIQHDEILNIPMDKKERREKLLKIFNKVPKEVIATEGAAIEVSRFDLSKLMSKEDAELYDKMLKKLEELDEKSGKKKTPENQARDILIALTCMKNCLTLVTNDNNLKKIAQEFQCSAITFEQLLKGEYREFKDTEIGKIPKDWRVIKLGDKELFKIIMGQSPPSSTYNKEGEGLPFLQGKMEFKEVYPSPVLYCSQPIKIAEQNDVLISVRAPVGDVNIAPYRLCIGRGLAAIRFNSEKANYWFYFYYLQKIKSFLENLGKGSTFKAITKDDLENLKVPYPLLSEQQKIAEILLMVDKKLEVERNEKTRLERIKQAMMDLLLTGKIRVKVN